MKKILWAVIVASLIQADTLFAKEEATQTAKVKIEGMTCSVCAAKIKKQWESLCLQSSVDWKSGEGTCSFDPAKAKAEDIVKAVEAAGFKGTLSVTP